MKSTPDPSRLPAVDQDQSVLEFSARYAPIIYADEREPFAPIAVGYSVFKCEEDSPSFVPRRRVEWASAGYPAVRAV